MLKKMRWRVIGAAMLAFSAVILLIAVLVNVVNCYLVTNRADDTLSHILEYEEHIANGTASSKLPPAPFMELADLESNYMTRFFTVRIDHAGKMISTSRDYIAAVEENEAVDYAKKALDAPGLKGYIGHYRYQKKDTDSATTICFLNTFREQQFMTSLRSITAAVAAGSLGLVFILVYFLSARAVRPFVLNAERQKRFITDASHELKTPLTSIAASIEVLSMQRGNNEWTENIRKQTEKMTRMVGELLALSKLNEGIPTQNKESFSLSDAAWEMADSYRTQAKAHEKEMEIDIQDHLTFFGEKESIQKMLSVLLDNAVRYSERNSMIDLSIKKNRGKINITVRNACHFDTLPETDRLFDRFYRPDASRNENTGGTGVGLAIAKAVAEAHGGTISAHCPDGTSMTITVTL